VRSVPLRGHCRRGICLSLSVPLGAECYWGLNAIGSSKPTGDDVYLKFGIYGGQWYSGDQ
jgi:hypothetical protein